MMQIGAVIVAAGMSSRMGDFKPMLNIGSISIAQRIVATFHQAGVTKIAVVTGYNAPLLERHLSNSGLVFLRNEDYASTQMFDSAKIGLAYLRDKCERILSTPVDIPLFTAMTVTELIESGAELCCPVCEGRTGHPLLIASSLVDAILADSGEGGLQGAIARCGAEMLQIPVEDPAAVPQRAAHPPGAFRIAQPREALFRRKDRDAARARGRDALGAQRLPAHADLLFDGLEHHPRAREPAALPAARAQPGRRERRREPSDGEGKAAAGLL